MSMRIRKGDRVLVIAGRDKDKTGKVIHVYPQKFRALVEGVNFVKKHIRKNPQQPQGGIVQKELPIHLSNLSLIDPVSSKKSRFRISVAGDGSKQRLASKSKAVIS
jgi:large subunit ribosomal protein L24